MIAAEAIAMPACPICGGRAFEHGPRGRMALSGALPRCAQCKSLERHRVARVMFDRLGPKHFVGWSAIQFSPDPTVDPAWFGSFELSVYGEANGIDIQSIDRADGTYDYVGCSHVLEHVGDDRKALHELLRITSPRGLLYLGIPDPFGDEPVTRDWGFPKAEKHGHWRVYGPDVVHRFWRYLPSHPVLAFRGQDPVTGERNGAFLLPKSAETYSWIVSQLGEHVELFSGQAFA